MYILTYTITILLLVGFFGLVLSDSAYAVPLDNHTVTKLSPDTIGGYFNILEKLYINGSTSYEYHLFVEGNKSHTQQIPYTLEFSLPPTDLFDMSGNYVTVVLKTNPDNSSQLLQAKSMSLDTILSKPASLTIDGSRLTTTQLDHVTLLAKFANTTTPSNGASWYESLFYNRSTSLYNYFAHHSYNKTLLKNNGIIDWFNTTLPNTKSYDTSFEIPILYNTIINEYFSRNLTLYGADNIIYNDRSEKLYYNNTHDDIDVITIVTNDVFETGIGGIAYLSPRQICDSSNVCGFVFININTYASLQRGALGQFSVVAHELGHNLNWRHSPPPLPLRTYDDPWSLMSDSYTTTGTVGIIGFNKYQSNWIEHSDVRIVLNNNLDTFKLTYLGENTIVNDTYKLAIIPFGTNGEYYTLEARTPSVFDKTPFNTTGLVLYSYNPFGQINTDDSTSPISLVQVTSFPFASLWYLGQSQSYNGVRNITITNVNITADYIEVEITNSELYPLLTTINTITTIDNNNISLSDFDRFGSSIAYGNINNDSALDLVIGSPYSDVGGSNSGSIHVVLSQSQSNTFAIDSTVTIDSSSIFSSANSSLFGDSIANIGDIDGNGIDEFLVGSPEFNVTGAAHILFFNKDASINHTVTINNDTMNGPNLSRNDYFGGSVANIGDLNNDGFSDLVIGADETSGLGALYIFFMNGSSILSNYRIDNSTVNTLDLSINGYFGSSVTTIGDLDQDGIVDLAVGSVNDGTAVLNSGSVYILFMNNNGSVKSTAKITDSTPNGPQLSFSDWFGRSLANVGDLNGDGINDLAVGAVNSIIMANSFGPSGIVYVLFLDTDGSVKSSTILSPSHTHEEYVYFGRSMAILNIDNTGVEIAIGANGGDIGGMSRGSVYILNITKIPFLKPTITLSSNVTSNSLVQLIITFDKQPFGFDQSDILITNGMINSFIKLNDTTFAVDILPISINDAVFLHVIENSSTDGDGYNNIESNNFTITYDTIPPIATLTLNFSNIVNKSYVDIIVNFSKPVFNFTNSSISIINANITNITTINSQQFVLTILPSSTGNVYVFIIANSTTSRFGVTNNASNIVTFFHDSEPPTIDNVILDEGIGVLSITFSETLTPFVNQSRLFISEFNSSNQISLSNTNTSIVNSTLTFYLNETRRQNIISLDTPQLDLLSATVQDLTGNFINTILDYNFTLIIPDTISPVVIINTTSTNFTSNYPITLDILFSETLSNSTFMPTVLNATFEFISNTTLSLTPTIRNGTIMVVIPAGIVQDTSNNSNLEYVFTIIYVASVIPSITSPSNPSSNSTTWFVSSSDNAVNTTWQWFTTDINNNCAFVSSNNINQYDENSVLIFTSNTLNTQKVCFSLTDDNNLTTFHESESIIPSPNIIINTNNSIILSETDSFLDIQVRPDTINHTIQYNTSAQNTTLAGFNFISNVSDTVNTLVGLSLFSSTNVTVPSSFWNGTFNLPKIVDVIIPSITSNVTINNIINTTTLTFADIFAVSMGADSSTLNFSQPVKLVFNTTAQNLSVFNQQSNQDPQLINHVCQSNDINSVHTFLTTNQIQECYILSNTGITIWTLHATNFGYYTLVSDTLLTTIPQITPTPVTSAIPISSSGGGGGGGGGGSSSANVLNSGITGDFSIYKVTWDIIDNNRILQIFTKQDSNILPSVSVRSSSLGVQSATLVSGKIGDSTLTFEVSLDLKDIFVSITADNVVGRQVLSIRKTITLTENPDEIIFDNPPTKLPSPPTKLPSPPAKLPSPPAPPIISQSKPIMIKNSSSTLIDDFVDTLIIKKGNIVLSDITSRKSLYDNFALVYHGISDQYVTTLLIQSDNRIIALLQISHTDELINSARAVSLVDSITIQSSNHALKSIDGPTSIDVSSGLDSNPLKMRHQVDTSKLILSDPISEFLDSITIHNLNTQKQPTKYFILQNYIITDNTFTIIGFSDRTDTNDSNNDVNIIFEFVSNNDSINRVRAVQLGGDKIMINDVPLDSTPELNVTYP